MKNSIFDVVDNKVIIKPEALLISPFKEIWANDKSKDKAEANKAIMVIAFYCHRQSPYKSIFEDERLQLIGVDVLNDKKYKPSKEVLEGIKKYESFVSPEDKLLDAVEVAIFKMEKFYRAIEPDSESIKKFSDSIVAMPKLMQSLKDARRIAESSEESGTKVRGNASLGMYE